MNCACSNQAAEANELALSAQISCWHAHMKVAESATDLLLYPGLSNLQDPNEASTSAKITAFKASGIHTLDELLISICQTLLSSNQKHRTRIMSMAHP